MLLKRELARAHTSLKLEELRNEGLPQLVAASTPEEYLKRGNDAVTKLMQFVERKKMLPVKANMDPALRAQIGEFVPEASRNFFYIASHLEPLALYTHFYHWWDLAQMRDEPHASPIRRGALLYNIWMSRAEGMATGFEEMTMHAGLYDDNPRAREVQWIMLAQRAARGLGSLYAQANEFTMKQAAGLPRRVDAARLDEPDARSARIRAAHVHAPAGLWHQLHHREIPHRAVVAGALEAARQGFQLQHHVRGIQRGRLDSGIADPMAVDGECARQGAVTGQDNRWPGFGARPRVRGYLGFAISERADHAAVLLDKLTS